MLGTREYTLCLAFRANAQNYSLCWSDLDVKLHCEVIFSVFKEAMELTWYSLQEAILFTQLIKIPNFF